MKVKGLCAIIILTVLFFCFCLPLTSFACWGSRPLAMGGAFTGVADTVDAVYWNPAGLATMKNGGFSSAFTNWNDYNYDIYLAFGRLTEDKTGGFALAYVYNKDYLADIFFEDGKRLGWITFDSNYYQFGYGRYIVKDWGLSIGATVKFVDSYFEIDVKDEYTYGDDEKITGDNLCDFDLGILWSFGPKRDDYKMFSIGCLVQNINESEFKFNLGSDIDDKLTQKFLTNIRPGLSFRPDKETIVSLEVYDAEAKIFDQPQIRVGMERSFTWKDTKGDKQQAFLRIGGYHVNAKKEDEIKAFTFGLQWGIVAYTLMNWTDSNRKTHFFAINVSF